MRDLERRCRFSERARTTSARVPSASANPGETTRAFGRIDGSRSGCFAIDRENHAKDHRYATGEALEPHFEPSLGLVQDTAEGTSGPIWVRGGIAVFATDGRAYEVRNRVTLCRCGASSNKPFCEGSHASIKFKDKE